MATSEAESFLLARAIQDSKPSHWYTRKPANQETGKTEFMKATYYITPEQDLKLERIRLARRQRGVKVDKSALVR